MKEGPLIEGLIIDGLIREWAYKKSGLSGRGLV